MNATLNQDLSQIDYQLPNWATKPPVGYFLDISNNGIAQQRLPVDSAKNYLLFGRNLATSDVPLEHESSSRNHAILIYHGPLDRFFIVDLGSKHGTFVGTQRLEAKKPVQLWLNTSFTFGLSGRQFTLSKPDYYRDMTTKLNGQSNTGAVLTEDENELDNITRFNTFANRIKHIDDENESTTFKDSVKKEDRRGIKRKKSIHFKEVKEVITPDLDVKEGKFKDLVQTSLIPWKKLRENNFTDRPSSPKPLDECHTPLQNIYIKCPANHESDSSKNDANTYHMDAQNGPLRSSSDTFAVSAVEGEQEIAKIDDLRQNYHEENNNLCKMDVVLDSQSPKDLLNFKDRQPINETRDCQEGPSVKTCNAHVVIRELNEDGEIKKRYVKESWPGKKI